MERLKIDSSLPRCNKFATFTDTERDDEEERRRGTTKGDDEDGER
jgi:hypothetical protein